MLKFPQISGVNDVNECRSETSSLADDVHPVDDVNDVSARVRSPAGSALPLPPPPTARLVVYMSTTAIPSAGMSCTPKRELIKSVPTSAQTPATPCPRSGDVTRRGAVARRPTAARPRLTWPSGRSTRAGSTTQRSSILIGFSRVLYGSVADAFRRGLRRDRRVRIGIAAHSRSNAGVRPARIWGWRPDARDPPLASSRRFGHHRRGPHSRSVPSCWDDHVGDVGVAGGRRRRAIAWPGLGSPAQPDLLPRRDGVSPHQWSPASLSAEREQVAGECFRHLARHRADDPNGDKRIAGAGYTGRSPLIKSTRGLSQVRVPG